MKICPICDTQLSGTFCPYCKRFIKDPIEISDGIHINSSHYGYDEACEFHKNDRTIPILNALHPEDEAKCEYHDPKRGGRHTTILNGEKTQDGKYGSILWVIGIILCILHPIIAAAFVVYIIVRKYQRRY